MPDPSLIRFRTVLQAALGHLEAHRQTINDLNVFPVADGDTGDNMVLTLRSVLEEVDHLAAQGELDEIGRDQIVDSVARAALLGARGNSGVILSQLIRGAAEELISRPGELVDPTLVGAAMAGAADRAYASVREPAEGTILTVVREMAHRIASEVAHMNEPRLASDVDAKAQDDSIAQILERALEAGQASVERGPELLPVLREAGVVDAGGFALTIICIGVVAALRGDELPPIDMRVRPRQNRPHHESSTYRFCTNFAVTGQDFDPAEWTVRLDEYGDSVLVVGDHTTLRIHIHTDDPDPVTRLFADVGTVSRVDVADMHQQMRNRRERLQAKKPCALVAVVASEGIAELFRGIGALPIDGGATMNPSTYDLLAAIHAANADEVVLLPNSSNVLMAADRAAELADKTVVVVASPSQQAGLLAGIEFDPDHLSERNGKVMNDALARVRYGAVGEAARDDAQARFKVGETVGFVGDQLVAWGEPSGALEQVLKQVGGEAELVTVIAGASPPLSELELAALVPAGVELDYAQGGQASYWWLVAAET